MADVGWQQAFEPTPQFLSPVSGETEDRDFQNRYFHGGLLLVDAAAKFQEEEDFDVSSQTVTDTPMAPTWTAGSLPVESIVNRATSSNDTEPFNSMAFFVKKLIQDASWIPGLVEVLSGPSLDEVFGSPDLWLPTQDRQFEHKDDLESDSTGKILADQLSGGEDDKELQHRVEKLLHTHGEEAVTAIEELIFVRGQRGELAWTILETLGRLTHEESLDARRSLLTKALSDSDPGLRYSAAMSLGDLGDTASYSVLSSRLPKESNPTVFEMIKAQLRAQVM